MPDAVSITPANEYSPAIGLFCASEHLMLNIPIMYIKQYFMWLIYGKFCGELMGCISLVRLCVSIFVFAPLRECIFFLHLCLSVFLFAPMRECILSATFASV